MNLTMMTHRLLATRSLKQVYQLTERFRSTSSRRSSLVLTLTSAGAWIKQLLTLFLTHTLLLMLRLLLRPTLITLVHSYMVLMLDPTSIACSTHPISLDGVASPDTLLPLFLVRQSPQRLALEVIASVAPWMESIPFLVIMFLLSTPLAAVATD